MTTATRKNSLFTDASTPQDSVTPDACDSAGPARQDGIGTMTGTLTGHGATDPVIHEVGDVTSVLDAVREEPWKSGLRPFDSLLARSQTSGRGQFRRAWASPAGNVYAALRLPMEPPFKGMEAAVALGAWLCGGLCLLGLDCRLKWPNDLVLEGKNGPAKVGGILLEEREGRLVAGVGINVLSHPLGAGLRSEAALPATSLAAYLAERSGSGAGPESGAGSGSGSGNGPSAGLPPGLAAFGRVLAAQAGCGREAVADGPGQPAALCRTLWKVLVKHVLSSYSRRNAPSAWRSVAETRLLWRGLDVVLKDGDERATGRLLGLGPRGELVLAGQGGTRSFSGGGLTRA